jgi:hypothetical protein
MIFGICPAAPSPKIATHRIAYHRPQLIERLSLRGNGMPESSGDIPKV